MWFLVVFYILCSALLRRQMCNVRFPVEIINNWFFRKKVRGSILMLINQVAYHSSLLPAACVEPDWIWIAKYQPDVHYIFLMTSSQKWFYFCNFSSGKIKVINKQVDYYCTGFTAELLSSYSRRVWRQIIKYATIVAANYLETKHDYFAWNNNIYLN